jgi:hypothetical protein
VEAKTSTALVAEASMTHRWVESILSVRPKSDKKEKYIGPFEIVLNSYSVYE